MSMVCGLDLHRQQITFDALEVESGEVWRLYASESPVGTAVLDAAQRPNSGEPVRGPHPS